MTEIQIADRRIGPGKSVFVIAEIGVNHDGSLYRALELVTAAADAGADAVKLQLFTASSLMNKSGRFAEYQSDRVADDTPEAMLRRYELSDSDVRTLVNVIRGMGMAPLATPFSPENIDLIEELDLPAIKIASPDLVNRVLLERAAAAGVPLLLSTGAATMEEVSRTAGWLRSWHAPFALLHCVSSYPTPDDMVNLSWIREIAQMGAPVGFSDHSQQLLAGALSVVAGACIVEKHLTYNRDASGPDHSASADPGQFREYVRMIRQADALKGSSGKRVLPIEQDVRSVSRQSLVLNRPLQPGERIMPDDLIVQRPGTGIPAAEIEVTIGKCVKSAIPAGTILQWDMLADAVSHAA